MKNFWIEGANIHLGMRAGAELMSVIERAKESILICSPYISSDLLDDLTKKYANGIKLRIITSPRDMQKSLTAYQSLIAHKVLRVIKYFDVENKNCDDFNWLHSKFYIVDDRQLFLGSLNFTKSGVHKNHEIVISTEDACAIKQFTKEFEWLWDNDVAQYEIPECCVKSLS